MKFKIPFLALLFVFALQAGAQSYFYNSNYYDNDITYEAGVSFGPMNSLTDVGGRPGYGRRGPKDLNIKSTTLFGSIYASALYKHFLALRAEATIGRVQSNDSLLKGIKSPNKAIGRYNRNLSFRSPIYEFSVTAEFHPINFFGIFNPDKSPSPFSPYLIGGIGFFHFNPQANLNGQWIDLRPLHTEGEGFAEYPNRKEYRLNQINIPIGVGISYEVSSRFNLRLEYISRVLFTDYLDDVHDTYIDPQLFSKYLSGPRLYDALVLNNRRRADAVNNQTTARPGGRRGNPNDNDSYFTVNIKVGFVFGRSKTNQGGGSSSGLPGKSLKKFTKKQKIQRQCPRRF
ncbi:MAG TPA: DUF6089 family protein [Hanamia sp.]|nr:DUF6089 family protein [Hanamia sp.]